MNLQIDTVKKEIHLLDMVPLDTLIAELEKLIPSYKEYKLTTYYPFEQPVYPPIDYPIPAQPNPVLPWYTQPHTGTPPWWPDPVHGYRITSGTIQ